MFPFYPSAVVPHVQNQRGPETFWFCPFADEISLQRVPVRGISIKQSCPRAGQPFLQGPNPISDSSRRGEMMAVPARAFDFFKYIPLPSCCFIDRRQTSFCSSAKRAFRECSICNMIAPMWMAEKWTDTNPLLSCSHQHRLRWFCVSPPSSFSPPEAQMTPLSPWVLFYYGGCSPHLDTGVTFYEVLYSCWGSWLSNSQPITFDIHQNHLLRNGLNEIKHVLQPPQTLNIPRQRTEQHNSTEYGASVSSLRPDGRKSM